MNDCGVWESHPLLPPASASSAANALDPGAKHLEISGILTSRDLKSTFQYGPVLANYHFARSVAIYTHSVIARYSVTFWIYIYVFSKQIMDFSST